MKVELFYWEDCPSYPKARRLVEQVLAERGLEAEIELREVRTEKDAAAWGFPGSPTVRIDGRDVDEAGSKSPPALGCRIYQLPEGISPIPSRQMIERALSPDS
jgi:hypothetical protein